MVGWAAVVFSLQNWLGETPEQARKAGTPAYLSVGMSLMAVLVASSPNVFTAIKSLMTGYRHTYRFSYLLHQKEGQILKPQLLSPRIKTYNAKKA